MKKTLFLATVLFFVQMFGSSALELIGTPSTTNPFAGRAIPMGASAAYFNPSLILELEDSLEVGGAGVFTFMNIDLRNRPGGYDVPGEVGSVLAPGGSDKPIWDGVNSFKPLPTEEVLHLRGRGEFDNSQDVFYLTMGAVKKIIDDDTAIAVYTLLPAGEMQANQPFYVDEREQFFTNSLHFELYGDSLTHPVVTLALARRLYDWISLGIGLSMENHTAADNTAYLPDVDAQDKMLLNADVKVKTFLYPNFSAKIRPLKELSIFSTLHLTSLNNIEMDTKTVVFGVTEVQNGEEHQKITRLKMKYSYGYQPVRVALGGTYDLAVLGSNLKFHGTLLYSRWSKYQNRHNERPLDEWADTISVTAGSRLEMATRSFGLDFIYYPTPVPDQVGRTNYVDNSRVGFGLGWEEVFNLGNFKLVTSAGFEGQFLIPRDHVKNPSAKHPVVDEMPHCEIFDAQKGEQVLFEGSKGLQTNNPGFPGFSSDGFFLSAGLQLRLEY